jgi:hypothetical protein
LTYLFHFCELCGAAVAAPQIITIGTDLDDGEVGINFYEKKESHHA